MWGLFLYDVLIALTLLYIPGVVALRFAGMGSIASFIYAPLPALLFYYINSYLLYSAGITSNWVTICLLSSLVLLLVAVFLRRMNISKSNLSSHFNFDTRQLLLVVAVCVLISGVYFILPLDSAESFYQENDNIAHLGTIRDYLNNGYFTSGSFLTSYPSLWLMLASFVAQAGNSEVTVAVNALNFVLVSISFPVSLTAFLSIFITNKLQVLFSGFLTLAFAVFPWGFLLFGPLYPNLMGFCLLPLVMSLFVSFCTSSSVRDAIIWVAAFLLGCVLLVRAHPGSVFAGVVFLTPFAASQVFQFGIKRGWTRTSSLCLSFLFVFMVLIGWVLMQNLPMFKGVVSFDWAAYLTVPEALRNVLFLRLTKASAPQVILSILVIVGSVSILRNKENLWLVIAHFIILVIYTACVSMPQEIQHLFSGYWYNDSFRVAALFVFSGVPLASRGLRVALETLSQFASRIYIERRSWKRLGNMLSYCLGCFVIFIIFMPSFSFRGFYWMTGFGKVNEMLSAGNSLATNVRGVDAEEWEFFDRVKNVVVDERVLNFPYDGSAYAYALANLNVVNRQWFGYKNEAVSNKSDIQLLASSLDLFGTCVDVEEAAKNEEISYILLLDVDAADKSGHYYSAGYSEEYWRGIESLKEDDSKFELVLAEHDMRLYRIPW